MTLARYLHHQIGARIAAVLAGLLALGLTLDLMENAPEVIERHGVGALTQYAALRAPVLLTFIAPLGILAGAVLAFITLAARNEMVILRASGVSTLALVLRLLPLALVLGLLNGILVGVLAPSAERTLLSRMPEVLGSRGALSEVWLRDVQTVVHIGRASGDGASLDQISIFELDREGALELRLDAARASFLGDGWLLEEVTRQRYPEPAEALPELVWSSRVKPQSVLAAAYRPELVDVREARRVVEGTLPMARSAPFYELRIWKDVAAVLVPLVMLLLSAQASFGISRAGGRPGLAALSLAAGAGYVVVDGVSSSLGEIGLLAPPVAALLSPLVFLLVGTWALLVIEE